MYIILCDLYSRTAVLLIAGTHRIMYQDNFISLLHRSGCVSVYIMLPM